MCVCDPTAYQCVCGAAGGDVFLTYNVYLIYDQPYCTIILLMPDAVIALKGVTKRYGSARGVSDVTLRVEEGSGFGFLGPNGAGKSTTINMLLDFFRPTSGELK